eukprot:Gb_16151 [translate_table: standard]
MEKISVGVRVRPPVKQDTCKGGHHWEIQENSISLCTSSGAYVHSYCFDNVFSSEASNKDVYQAHSKQLAMAAVGGFNGTVFAYGQTSSGKTYTMLGTAVDPGIIPLAVFDVFESIKMIADREFLIRVSFMEIYNEEIKDLLSPENCKLEIHENQERGVFVAGLKELVVSSPQQVLAILECGEVHRHFGETNMNASSSRSHTIFRMVIESRNKTPHSSDDVFDTDAVRVSALHMVDLAGFERISKTGAGGARLREGTYINKSLVTLSSVMKKLSDGVGNQGGHIPYRDSKLTRVLQPVLGGNAKTSIICTVSPDQAHIDETRGTLLFASRAKKVTTCAYVNEVMTDAALLKRQKKEIEELRLKLQGKLAEELDKQVLKLRNDLLKFELEREKLALQLEEEKKAQAERERRIKEQEQTIENLSTMVIGSSFNVVSSHGRMPKARRRETWCSHRLSLELSYSQSSLRPRKEAPSSVTIRSETACTLPTFEDLLSETEKDWCHTRSQESITADVVNTADESTWISLNRVGAFSKPIFSILSAGDGQQISEDIEMDLSREAGSMEQQLQKVLEENSRLKAQLEEKKRMHDSCGNFIVRILELQDRERNLREMLKQTWMQLLQAQEREQMLRKENFSLLVSKIRAEKVLDQIQGQLELLEKSLIQAPSEHDLRLHSIMVRDIALSADMHIANIEDTNSSLQLLRGHPSLDERDSWSNFSDVLAVGQEDMCNIADPDELIMNPSNQELQIRYAFPTHEMDSSLTVFSHGGPVIDTANFQGWGRNFSEEERLIAFKTLKKICMQNERIRALEANLAAAELHVVELKVEVEDMRARLQALDLESPTNMEIELQNLRSRCDYYREEIKLIMKQVPTPEQEAQRQNEILKVQQDNRKLQLRLAKVKRHILHAKNWQKEIKRLKQADKERKTLQSQLEEVLKTNERLEQELGKLKQGTTHPPMTSSAASNKEERTNSKSQLIEGHHPSQDSGGLETQGCQERFEVHDIVPTHAGEAFPLKEQKMGSHFISAHAECGPKIMQTRSPLKNLDVNVSTFTRKPQQLNFSETTLHSKISNKENVLQNTRDN